jgi:hypothetical protein
LEFSIYVLSEFIAFRFEFPAFIPSIHLQGNQNPDYYKQYFSYCIGQIPGDPVLGEELLADFAEE